MLNRGLWFAFYILLFAFSLLVTVVCVFGEAIWRVSATARRDDWCEGGALAGDPVGEFDFHRALEGYEKLIDALAAAGRP